MRDELSTRQAGEQIDVDHTSIWRWRHKVMAFLASPIIPQSAMPDMTRDADTPDSSARPPLR